MEKFTTISIRADTRERLASLKIIPRESFDDLITRMINDRKSEDE